MRSSTRSTRRPAVITVGALGTAALALSMSGTLSAFTASITDRTTADDVDRTLAAVRRVLDEVRAAPIAPLTPDPLAEK